MLISILNPAYERYFLPNTQDAFRRIDYNNLLPSTVDVVRTTEKVSLLTGVMALSVALFYLVRRRRDIRHILNIIFINSLVLGIVGTVFNLMGTDRILGMFDPVNTMFFSSFRYHNHWAGFTLLCLGVGLALYSYYHSKDDARKSRSRTSTFFLGMLFFLALSIPLSGGRTGMLLLIVMGVLFFFRLWWSEIQKRRRGYHRRYLLTKLVAVVTVVMVVTWLIYQLGEEMIQVRWEKSIHRYEDILRGEAMEMRVYSTRDTQGMALDKPWWGWGLGSFTYAFKLYAGPEFYRGKHYLRMEFAHQDWLQYWAELGTVGFAALLALPVFIVIIVLRRGKSNPVTGWLAVGCGLILVMACFEFPLSNPAIIALFFILGTLAAKYALLESQMSKVEGRRRDGEMGESDKG